MARDKRILTSINASGRLQESLKKYKMDGSPKYSKIF